MTLGYFRIIMGGPNMSPEEPRIWPEGQEMTLEEPRMLLENRRISWPSRMSLR